MTPPDNLNVSLNLSRSDLDKAIAAAVDAQVSARVDEFLEQIRVTMVEKQRTVNKDLEAVFATSLADKESIEKIRDAAVGKQAQVSKDLDTLFTQVAGAKRDIEDQIDKIREKVTRRANWYLIPTATVILLAGILGLWAIVGANATSLRSTVNSAIEEANKLQGKTSDANAALAKVQQDLIQAQQLVLANQDSIEQIKKQNPFAEHKQALDKLTQQNADLTKRLATVEDWIAKHKNLH
jgi:hypothetical protein